MSNKKGHIDTIAQAAHAAADAMAQAIQGATDTNTGDTAGLFFSGPEMEALKEMAERLLTTHQVAKAR